MAKRATKAKVEPVTAVDPNDSIPFIERSGTDGEIVLILLLALSVFFNII